MRITFCVYFSMYYLWAPKCTFFSVFDFKKDLKWKKKRSKINSVTMDEDEIDELRQSSSQKQQDRRKAGQAPNSDQTGPNRNWRPESNEKINPSQKQHDRRKAGQAPNRGQTGPDRNQRPESSKRVWTRWYFISVHFRAENYWPNEKHETEGKQGKDQTKTRRVQTGTDDQEVTRKCEPGDKYSSFPLYFSLLYPAQHYWPDVIEGKQDKHQTETRWVKTGTDDQKVTRVRVRKCESEQKLWCKILQVNPALKLLQTGN